VKTGAHASLLDRGVTLTDDEFLQAFERAAITRAQWTHEAHIRMAWLYCRREPTLEAALTRMRAGIPRLNDALGTDPTLYHDTVTRAFGTIVYRRATAPNAAADFRGFCEAHPDLFDRDRPILHRHYAPDTLKSDEARVGFVPPDRDPL
jgi:hypothetical protein